MGTITIKERCLVKEGFAYIGTKEDIVNQICTFRIDENRKLHFKFKRFPEEQLIGFSDEFTEEEMYKEAYKYLYNRADLYGYREYVKLK